MTSDAILGLIYTLIFKYKHKFSIQDIWNILGEDWERHFKSNLVDFQDRYSLNLEEIEKEAIIEALIRTNYVQSDASELLGITARALNYKIENHNIKHKNWKKNSEHNGT